MNHAPMPVDFETLDAHHRDIHTYLARLATLARHMAEGESGATVEHEAAAVEAFFSGTSRQHHIDEERSVFPPLLESRNAELVDAVQTLRQDHGWIEENWLELAPQLRAIADGNHWVEPEEFQHAVEVFVELSAGHVSLEESLIYPESKARWAKVLAGRSASSSGPQEAGPQP